MLLRHVTMSTTKHTDRSAKLGGAAEMLKGTEGLSLPGPKVGNPNGLHAPSPAPGLPYEAQNPRGCPKLFCTSQPAPGTSERLRGPKEMYPQYGREVWTSFRLLPSQPRVPPACVSCHPACLGQRREHNDPGEMDPIKAALEKLKNVQSSSGGG